MGALQQATCANREDGISVEPPRIKGRVNFARKHDRSVKTIPKPRHTMGGGIHIDMQ